MEDNKLIAEFMGCTNPFNDITDATLYKIEQGTFEIGELKYHTSWDWLMPVVQKIKRTDLSREMVMQGMDELIDAFDTADIETTYDAVVEFIKELNKK